MAITDRAPDTPILSCEGIAFSYGGAAVLEDVGFSIASGEFVALVGPNGSGKSTLIRTLLGLLEPQAGAVRIFGAEPRRLAERWRVGYVPQRAALPKDLPATAEELIAAGRLGRSGWLRPQRAADRAAVDLAIEAVGLGHLRARRLRELSGGEQQRALIAKALASEPELLILDEPIAGVDSASQRRFRDVLVGAVRERRAAVLLVSHELGAVADDLDRIIVLKRRVLFDGSPARLAESGVSLGIHQGDLPFWLEELH